MHFRFTIRDLLWLTLVVALAVGWWVSNLTKSKIDVWLVKNVNGAIVMTDENGNEIVRLDRGSTTITGHNLNYISRW